MKKRPRRLGATETFSVSVDPKRSERCARIVGSVEIMKAAGLALARAKDVDARLTIDAIVIATAALLDATVVTGDAADFEQLSRHFPGVAVLST